MRLSLAGGSSALTSLSVSRCAMIRVRSVSAYGYARAVPQCQRLSAGEDGFSPYFLGGCSRCCRNRVRATVCAKPPELTMNQYLYRTLSYDPLNDFAPITTTAKS